MKTFAAFLLLVLLSGALEAQTTDKPIDLTTTTGKTYKQARFFRQEPDGITYMFAGGMVKIPFTELPEAICKQYGYDPKAAARFSAEDEAAQSRAYAAAQEATNKAESDKIAILEHTDPASRKEKVMALIEKGRLTGDFRVSQITDTGFIAYPQGALKDGEGGSGALAGPIFITGYDTEALTDDAVVHLTIYLAGTYKYTTVTGAGKTVTRYASRKDLAFKLCLEQFAH